MGFEQTHVVVRTIVHKSTWIIYLILGYLQNIKQVVEIDDGLAYKFKNVT